MGKYSNRYEFIRTSLAITLFLIGLFLSFGKSQTATSEKVGTITVFSSEAGLRLEITDQLFVLDKADFPDGKVVSEVPKNGSSGFSLISRDKKIEYIIGVSFIERPVE